MPIRKSNRRRPVELVRQATYFECGLACLVMVARSFGADVSLSGVRKSCPPSARGMTLNGMVEVARQLGLRPSPVAINVAGLESLKLPAILHWGFSHYVVLVGYDGRRVDIVDPGHGRRRLTVDEVAPLITGVAIEFEDCVPNSMGGVVKPLRFGDLLHDRKGLAGPAALTAAVSLALELLLVLIPWLVARMADGSGPGGGKLKALALLAIIVVLALGATRGVRGALVIRLSALTQASVMTTAFGRLMAKPPLFFEQRYSTYVVSRFEGTDRLRTVLSDDYLNAFIDLIMLAVILCAIGTLSLSIMAVTAAVAFAVGSFRYVVGLLSREHLDQVVHARSLERLHLMETIRSIRALKQFGKTAGREKSFGRRLDNSIMHQANLGWYKATSEAGASFLSDAGWVGIALYVVASNAAGPTGAAALFALILYARLLIDRAALLSGKLAEVGTIKVQLEHLADLVEPEPPAPVELQERELSGQLSVSGLTFGYDSDAPVLRDFAIEVAPGEMVALQGPSGTGKTTLLKLIAGLLPATQGSIRWSGVEMERLSPRSVQQALAFVFQDEELLEGDILSNVTLFDEHPDVRRVWEACRIAQIFDEIQAMPMRLQTMVGERGSALSGGQRQRLLIARALYHQPRILLLDEATSQLDVANEKAIHAALRQLGLTIILVSHRPEAVASADRLVTLGRSNLAGRTRAHA
ncbi:MAG: ATP-binding cassette, subfamily bacterial CvaB/MchF/RaxB [Sphingomonadales bacterium]|jgi:ATP-binding cassette subfamily B protein RaxB|nr:ATP-binding cassette, subfamily bacterial CvaB/MchF/RaxB [Sphingomonadales bacterium]